MEALSAIGLAGNLLQFVDYSCKLFSSTHEIYTSATGMRRDCVVVQDLTLDMQEFTSMLKLSLSCGATCADEVRLVPLVQRCQQAADELLKVLKRLIPKENQSRWSSFKAALKVVWKQDEIDRMHQQLIGLRLELIMRLQAMSMNDSSTVQALLQLREENAFMRSGFDRSIQQLQTNVAQILKRMEQKVKADINEPRNAIPRFSRDGNTEYSQELSTISETMGDIQRAIGLLKSLYYDGADYRYSKVCKAYAGTFMWAYQHSFSQWLRSERTLFWVSGKPGSGKSTLMKYLVDNPETTTHLQQWAAHRELTIASYFFWVNGNHLQRSQEGLLRSILLDTIRQVPTEMVDIISSTDRSMGNETQANEGSLTPPWDFHSLLFTLESVLRRSENNRCFCFFIDGLDEYDGELDDLISFVERLQAFPNVKLCLASRPWNMFEAAFGADLSSKFYVQDLTRADITLYVSEKLQRHTRDRGNVQAEADLEPLIHEIVGKAQGVFLWVYLVVKSLIEGLQNADRVIDLRRRLNAFPADLDEYFRYILGSLDPIYKAQAARGFQAVIAAPGRLSILQFWYLDQEEEDPGYALNMCIPKVADLPLLRQIDKQRADVMAKRINGRFKGLLEVTNERSGRYYLTDDGAGTTLQLQVDFLHRTVRDFLSTKDCYDKIKSWTPNSFQVDESLCKAYLADLKDCCARKECLMNSSHFTRLVKDIFKASEMHRMKTGKGLTRLVQELRNVVNTPSPGLLQQPLWSLLGEGSFESFAAKHEATNVLNAGRHPHPGTIIACSTGRSAGPSSAHKDKGDGNTNAQTTSSAVLDCDMRGSQIADASDKIDAGHGGATIVTQIIKFGRKPGVFRKLAAHCKITGSRRKTS